MTTRSDLAAALSTVDGITGYEWSPAANKSGDAWPQLASLDRGDIPGFEQSWLVHVRVPGSNGREAAEWAEANAETLVAALLPVAYTRGVIMPDSSGTGPYLMTLDILPE